MSGFSILFFPRNESQLDTWWISVLIGLALLGLSLLFFRRRKLELAAHERWISDYAAWKQEQDAIVKAAHFREMERLEKQLEIEKLSLGRTKAQIQLDFGSSDKGPLTSHYEGYKVAGTSYRQDII